MAKKRTSTKKVDADKPHKSKSIRDAIKTHPEASAAEIAGLVSSKDEFFKANAIDVLRNRLVDRPPITKIFEAIKANPDKTNAEIAKMVSPKGATYKVTAKDVVEVRHHVESWRLRIIDRIHDVIKSHPDATDAAIADIVSSCGKMYKVTADFVNTTRNKGKRGDAPKKQARKPKGSVPVVPTNAGNKSGSVDDVFGFVRSMD